MLTLQQLTLHAIMRILMSVARGSAKSVNSNRWTTVSYCLYLSYRRRYPCCRSSSWGHLCYHHHPLTLL